MKVLGSPVMALRMCSAMEDGVKAFCSSAESRTYGCRAVGRSRKGMCCNRSSTSCAEENRKSSACAIQSDRHTKTQKVDKGSRRERERDADRRRERERGREGE